MLIHTSIINLKYAKNCSRGRDFLPFVILVIFSSFLSLFSFSLNLSRIF